MSYLVVGGVTVDVAEGSAQVNVDEIGDRFRAFDGTMNSSIRAYKKSYDITTIPMTDANADTLEAALQGSQPVACSGDLTGSVNCHVQPLGRREFETAPGRRVVVRFRLYEV